MKYKTLFIFFIALNLLKAQNTIGVISLENNASEGFTLFTQFTETYLINNCGEVINQWSSSYPPGNAVYLLENGNILRAGRTSSTDFLIGGQGGIIEMFDWDGDLVWQYLYDTTNHRQHHDVFPMPNGNVLILAVTKISNTEAIQAGRNPSLLPEAFVYNEQIIEVQPSGLTGGTIVWEWNLKDHLVQDFDNTKDNFGNVSLSKGKLDINFLNGGNGGANWIHANSMQYNAVLDQIILSARLLSEFYIIDHSTSTIEAATNTGGTYGNGGDFLYRWGNPQAYKLGTKSDQKLFGQHYVHPIATDLNDAGKIMLFNNGLGRDPLFSEVFVLEPPTDSPGFYTNTTNIAFGPETIDYIYNDLITPTNFFSNILSSAQRLPNGNTLICEGINGEIFEIDTNENLVWQYISPVNNNTGAIATQGDNPASIANAMFRAIKYPLDYVAFNGRDLTPKNPIEINPDLTFCNILSLSDFSFNNTTIYPNPVRDNLIIESTVKIERVELYNIFGTKLFSFSNTNTINLSKLNSGLYIIKIYNNKGKPLTHKLVKK